LDLLQRLKTSLKQLEHANLRILQQKEDLAEIKKILDGKEHEM